MVAWRLKLATPAAGKGKGGLGGFAGATSAPAPASAAAAHDQQNIISASEDNDPISNLLSELFKCVAVDSQAEHKFSMMFKALPKTTNEVAPKSVSITEAAAKVNKLVTAVNHHQKLIDDGETALTNLNNQVAAKTKQIQQYRDEMIDLEI